MLTGFVRSLAGMVGAPLAILIVFLGIVGVTLFLTPRIAKWLDRKDSTHHSYFEGMMEEDPTQSKRPSEKEQEQKAPKE